MVTSSLTGSTALVIKVNDPSNSELAPEVVPCTLILAPGIGSFVSISETLPVIVVCANMKVQVKNPKKVNKTNLINGVLCS